MNCPAVGGEPKRRVEKQADAELTGANVGGGGQPKADKHVVLGHPHVDRAVLQAVDLDSKRDEGHEHHEHDNMFDGAETERDA